MSQCMVRILIPSGDTWTGEAVTVNVTAMSFIQELLFQATGRQILLTHWLRVTCILLTDCFEAALSTFEVSLMPIKQM